MYRPSAFAQDDVALLHTVIRERGFATIAASVNGEVQLAYAPVVLDEQPLPRGRVRFHLARANPLAALDDSQIRLSFLGPDSYISPDWYETQGLVPTWNYIAVEGAGTVQRLDEEELERLLIDLSAVQEERLRPKQPWTVEKVPPEKMAGLLRAIVGFEVAFDALEGEFKLSQDKQAAEVANVISRLEALGKHATAAAMHEHAQSNKPKR